MVLPHVHVPAAITAASPAACSDVLEQGLECNYTDEQSGQMCTVKILKVHHDDQPPYYTIRMPNGNERETVRGRLARRQPTEAPPAVPMDV